jgi:hypothetical protein
MNAAAREGGVDDFAAVISAIGEQADQTFMGEYGRSPGIDNGLEKIVNASLRRASSNQLLSSACA